MLKISLNIPLLLLLLLAGAGCQNTNFDLTDLFDADATNKDIAKSNKSTSNKNPFDTFFSSFKTGSNQSDYEEIKIKSAAVQFRPFLKNNLRYNVLAAVKAHPSVRSAIANVRSAKANINTAKSAKSTQVSFQALSGFIRENSSNSLGAAGSVNLSRLIYDAGAVDSSVLSQEQRYSLAKMQAEISAETIVLRAYEVWINLHRQQKVLAVYDRGLALSDPLLGQIKNISLSGLADKAMILKAQQDYSKLEVAYARAQAETQGAIALFSEMFPGGDFQNVSEIPSRNILEGEKAKKAMLKNAAVFKAQNFLVGAFEAELMALKAQKKPNISMSAGVTAPAEDTLDDSSANLGLSLNYIFNDGGRLDSQIESLKEKIRETKHQKKTLERELVSQLNVATETYLGAKKTYFATLELVNLSKEVRDTSKDQLVSGRSKIQDVLNAEVTLAENRIQSLIAEAEYKLASYRIAALTNGLTKEIGWKPF